MNLFECLCFFMSAECNLKAGNLQAEADRIRQWNEPWARNLERKAKKYGETAKVWSGQKPAAYAPMYDIQ
jgi:phage protein D